MEKRPQARLSWYSGRIVFAPAVRPVAPLLPTPRTGVLAAIGLPAKQIAATI